MLHFLDTRSPYHNKQVNHFFWEVLYCPVKRPCAVNAIVIAYDYVVYPKSLRSPSSGIIFVRAILCTRVEIRNTNAGKDPCFVDIKSTSVVFLEF